MSRTRSSTASVGSSVGARTPPRSCRPATTTTAWADALAPEFDKATDAGAALWSELAGTSAAAAPDGETGRDVLDTRVSAFLSLHRAHLRRTFADADEDGVDPSELADRFRSAYRDLRSSLSEFAGDLAVAGFAEGERRARGPRDAVAVDRRQRRSALRRR